MQFISIEGDTLHEYTPQVQNNVTETDAETKPTACIGCLDWCFNVSAHRKYRESGLFLLLFTL